VELVLCFFFSALCEVVTTSPWRLGFTRNRPGFVSFG